jgi:tetraacyldisaccharide 4'-kinase
LLYGFAVWIRNRFYDAGFFKQYKPDIHTIGVGNLIAGGAGKTPMVEYLINLLLGQNFKVTTLSRGYKRKTRGLVVADEHSSAEDIGDEPLIYKTKYPVQVIVNASRVEAVKHIEQFELRPDMVLLDDVFQHRAIKCGITILVTEYASPFFNDSLLPVGRLREPKSGMQRADVIVVTKTPEKTTPVELRNFLKDIKPLAHQQVFFSYLKYGDLYAVNHPEQKFNIEKQLFNYHVMVITGIANAAPMITYLKEYAEDVYHFPFEDHHEYIPKELEDIQRYYEQLNKPHKMIVTTEKDFMRLKNKTLWPLVSRMNLYVLPVEVSFKDKEEEFNQLILKYARTNKFYHQKYSREN